MKLATGPLLTDPCDVARQVDLYETYKRTSPSLYWALTVHIERRAGEKR